MLLNCLQTLGELHQNGIIHNNLNPENIFINPKTSKIKISDLSLSINFYMKSENHTMNYVVLKNLKYASPELFGIVGNGIDYRSDYYSLGVVFYEMLTGQLPLNAEDYDGWIYAHVSKKIKAPDKINPDIPSAISDIILKLLSKTVDERYQTAQGLLRDLEECRRQLNISGKIEPFFLGQQMYTIALRYQAGFWKGS